MYSQHIHIRYENQTGSPALLRLRVIMDAQLRMCSTHTQSRMASSSPTGSQCPHGMQPLEQSLFTPCRRLQLYPFADYV